MWHGARAVHRSDRPRPRRPGSRPASRSRRRSAGARSPAAFPCRLLTNSTTDSGRTSAVWARSESWSWRRSSRTAIAVPAPRPSATAAWSMPTDPTTSRTVATTRATQTTRKASVPALRPRRVASRTTATVISAGSTAVVTANVSTAAAENCHAMKSSESFPNSASTGRVTANAANPQTIVERRRTDPPIGRLRWWTATFERCRADVREVWLGADSGPRARSPARALRATSRNRLAPTVHRRRRRARGRASRAAGRSPAGRGAVDGRHRRAG